MDHDSKVLKKAFSANLKKYRKKFKLTQEEAAEKANLSLNYWQRLEMVSQDDLPILPTLARIAKVFKVKARDLLS